MEGQAMDLNGAASNEELIGSFMEITSATKEEAVFFLESHQWDLDAAVSTFLDNTTTTTTTKVIQPNPQPSVALLTRSPSEDSSDYSPSRSRSRSLSPAHAEPLAPRVRYALRSKGKKKPGEGGSGVHTLADLNHAPGGDSEEDDEDEDEDDEAQQYYAGGENSGMLVQAPKEGQYDGDGIFDQARQMAVERPADLSRSSSSTRSFTGQGRSIAGDTVLPASQPPEMVNHAVILWRNGFTVDDGPLRRYDDPANASFLESIRMSECPRELEPVDGRTKVHLDLKKQEENYAVRPTHLKCKTPFPGVGRTLADSPDSDSTVQVSNPAIPAASSAQAQGSAMGLVVDSSLPTTSIQLRLADGTRMVSRFNLHHTIRDIRGFIEASRVGGSRNYQLQTMGFPPKQLSDQDQTIGEAGIASSVVIQKF